MSDAEKLRLIANSTAVAGFIPLIAETLHAAANSLDQYAALTGALRAELDQLGAQLRDIQRQVG